MKATNWGAGNEEYVDPATIAAQQEERPASAHRRMVHFLYQRLAAGPGGSVLLHIVVLLLILNLAMGVSRETPPGMPPVSVWPEAKPPDEPVTRLTPVEPPFDPTVATAKEIDLPATTLSIGNPAVVDGSEGLEDGNKNNIGFGTENSTVPGFQADPYRSVLTLPGWFSPRTGKGRNGQLDRFNPGHQAATETAVLRALRWLKQEQLDDGSWPTVKPAMTGLAILCYLAHNELPGQSKEFGETVKRALMFLCDSQEDNGHFRGRDTHDYSHPIATYALCEAYGMTRIQSLRYAAQKAVGEIIRNQHADGGFNYNLNQENRNDTSYMAWCAQALKAAKIANVLIDGPETLDQAMRKAVLAFRKNFQEGGGSDYGGFGYTGPGKTGLTGAGVLSMQLLGATADKEVREGIRAMSDWKLSWTQPMAGSALYYWYYATQAKFNEGGDAWTRWNEMLAPVVAGKQQVVANALAGPDGGRVAVGYWDTPAAGEHHDGRVMDTCLCTLMLEVYYRYLPSFITVVQAEGSKRR